MAVPFWAYVAAAQTLIAFTWQFGLLEPEKIAPVHVRITQHVLLMLISLPAWMLALRIGLPKGRRARAGILQLLLGMSFAALVRPTLIVTWIFFVPEARNLFAAEFATLPEGQLAAWSWTSILYLMIYGFGLALVFGLATFLELRDEKLRAERLQNQFMRARLQALRMQLNPHFLFNTLHTVTALIGKQPKVAGEMLVRLSDLLRRVLEDGGADRVSLRQELELTRNYLDIESLRFRDRLKVSFDIDPLAGAALVPSMILQPLVENAVKHGIADDGELVEIAIGARRERQWLEIAVRNTGAPPDRAAGAPGAGVGLENLRERLRAMFGERASVEAGRESPRHFLARVRFPYAADPAANHRLRAQGVTASG